MFLNRGEPFGGSGLMRSARPGPLSPAMLAWTVIWTGVVAGVAAGPSSPHWRAASARYGRRREMKAKEAEARSFERTPRAGAHQVVRELRGNADGVR